MTHDGLMRLVRFDRLAAVQVVRLVAGALALAVVSAVPELATSGWPLRPAVAAWLALTTIAEVARRLTASPIGVAVALLAVDGVVLGTLVAHTGGFRSPLLALVHLHVAAVSLLASHRVGVRVAVWHGIVQFASFVLAASGTAQLRLPAGTTVDTAARLAAVNAGGFLLLAMGVTVFSAMKERVLRRTQREIGALAAVGRATTVAAELPAALRTAAASLLETLGVAAVAVLVEAPEGGIGVAVTPGGSTEVGGGTAPRLTSPSLLRSPAELGPTVEALLPGASNVAALPLRIDDEAHGALLVAFGGGPRRQVPETTVVALEQAARLISSTVERARLHARLEQLATRDALTGLVNRRVFEDALAREIARSQRTRAPLSLVVVDVDHFKRVNDTYGHHVGDEVLRHVGSALGGRARAFDLVARFGGEEFVALLPGCGPADASTVAEDLRTAVAADGPPVPVTASAGVASYPDQATDGASLFEAADAALYEAKRSGRDRTVQAARRIRLVAG